MQQEESVGSRFYACKVCFSQLDRYNKLQGDVLQLTTLQFVVEAPDCLRVILRYNCVLQSDGSRPIPGAGTE